MKTLFAACAALALAPFANAVEVNVSFSDDLTEKLNEDYGARESTFLSDTISADLEKALGKMGVEPARVDITVVDAKPSKPTFEQLTDRPSLSFSASRSAGGMALEGTAFDAEGNVIASQTYDWFETSLRHASAVSTWGDARRVSRRFAHKLSGALAN